VEQVPEHYAGMYRHAAADTYAEVRRAIYGEDLGQNSWLTREELDRFAAALRLGPAVRLLDVACGSGGPAMHLVRTTGCVVTGVDASDDAITAAGELAGAGGKARFLIADAAARLPFDDGAFDAIVCIDAINHLASRPAVLADWARLLRPGGRLSYTDALVVTGPVSSDEVAVRASIGYQVVTPPGANERLLEAAGLHVLEADDLTDSFARIAARRRDVRAGHADTLRQIEGDAAFDGRQQFFDLTARLAEERRLSRFAYLAERPA
jgi:SAM-dependent methyltransferase